MHTLFLDLSSNSTEPHQGSCIACVTEDTTVAIRFVDHRISDDGLIPLINDVLAEVGWTLKDLTNIACVAGPGGFTSLRMAVTLANTYADQLQIPVAGVHLSDVYEARVKLQAARHKLQAKDLEASRLKPESFFWFHSTKKTQLFVREFGEYASLWPNPVLVANEELLQKLPQGAVIAGELIPEHREMLSAHRIVDAPAASISDTLPSFLRQQEYTEGILLPWYGRGW